MLKKILSICTISLAFFIFNSSTALACNCKSAQMGYKIHEILEKLDLSDEQKDKIKMLSTKTHEMMQAKRAEMHDLIMTINTSYMDGSISEPKIDEFAHKKMEIMGAIIKARMLERFEISKILTDAQKQEVNKMLQEWLDNYKNNKPQSCSGSN